MPAEAEAARRLEGNRAVGAWGQRSAKVRHGGCGRAPGPCHPRAATPARLSGLSERIRTVFERGLVKFAQCSGGAAVSGRFARFASSRGCSRASEFCTLCKPLSERKRRRSAFREGLRAFRPPRSRAGREFRTLCKALSERSCRCAAFREGLRTFRPPRSGAGGSAFCKLGKTALREKRPGRGISGRFAHFSSSRLREGGSEFCKCWE